jgi:hypothetical protein
MAKCSYQGCRNAELEIDRLPVCLRTDCPQRRSFLSRELESDLSMTDDEYVVRIARPVTLDNRRERTIEAKIARLRQRLKNTPMDASVRAILMGFLDLLEDEL